MVYASHGIVNLSKEVRIQQPSTTSTRSSIHTGGSAAAASEKHQETIVWNVTETLRTGTVGANDRKRTITALAHVVENHHVPTTNNALATGFSDGTITVWMKRRVADDADEWQEFVVVEPPPPSVAKLARSITASCWGTVNRSKSSTINNSSSAASGAFGSSSCFSCTGPACATRSSRSSSRSWR